MRKQTRQQIRAELLEQLVMLLIREGKISITYEALKHLDLQQLDREF